MINAIIFIIIISIATTKLAYTELFRYRTAKFLKMYDEAEDMYIIVTTMLYGRANFEESFSEEDREVFYAIKKHIVSEKFIQGLKICLEETLEYYEKYFKDVEEPTIDQMAKKLYERAIEIRRILMKPTCIS